ncbi:MAG: hypothetical protein K6F50_09435 [Kiritimatiellae bacterium]|nr:hypothetical protein [Kiritimatiellia bacterium]
MPPDAKPVVIKPVVIKPVVIKPVDDKPAITQPVDRPVTIYDRSSATSWANGSRADSVGAEMRVTPFRLGVADAFALPSPKDLDVCGLNLSLFAGSSRSVYGVTGAGVLDETGKLYGIGFGMFSVCDELYGVQCALFVNYARKAAYGLQIGMVNQAPATSKVVQIGLFNMIDRSGFWKNRAIPILNMQF